MIIEPTSGNTGIGLSYFGCKKGYRVIFPDGEDRYLSINLYEE